MGQVTLTGRWHSHGPNPIGGIPMGRWHFHGSGALMDQGRTFESGAHFRILGTLLSQEHYHGSGFHSRAGGIITVQRHIRVRGTLSGQQHTQGSTLTCQGVELGKSHWGIRAPRASRAPKTLTSIRLKTLIFTDDSTWFIWVRVESNLTHDSWVEHNPGQGPTLGSGTHSRVSGILSGLGYSHAGMRSGSRRSRHTLPAGGAGGPTPAPNETQNNQIIKICHLPLHDLGIFA